MALSKHTNVLRVRGEWVDGSKLYIAVRYMSPGSLLDIARYAFPDGFEESVIATVVKQALDGLTCSSHRYFSELVAHFLKQIYIKMDGFIEISKLRIY